MKCPNCNTEVKDEMKFCPKCGSDIPQVRYCSNCGTELKNGMSFCPKCGKSQDNSPKIDGVTNETKANPNEIVCPICSHPLTIEDKFCPNCHRELFYNCNNCKNDITYGEIIKKLGCCPKCGTRINNLYNIPNDKYPFAIQTPKQNYNENVCQNQVFDSNTPNDQGGNTIFSNKWIVIAIYCIVLIILGNSLSALGGLIWGIGGAWVYYKKWGWKTWKPYVCLLSLYLVISLTFGSFDDSYKESGSKAILRELKSPSTAEFISYVSPSKANAVYEDYLKVKLKDYQDVAVFEVEAENSFGGRIRNNFYVFYVDKNPVAVLEEESALNPNRSYVLNALNYKGWNK